MMDFRAPEPPRRPESVLPMVNLVFLLLVFFLMVATLAPPAHVPVEPPRADGAPPSDTPALRLHMNSAGILTFGIATGEAALDLARRQADGGTVALRADRAAPAAALAATLAALAPLPVVLIVEPGPAAAEERP
jgi:biopolymer transport protein ExbD